MNIVVTCRKCDKIIASVNKKDKEFSKVMQKQLADHRKKYPDHNSFSEKEGLL